MSHMLDETRRLVESGLDQWSLPYDVDQIDQLHIYRDLLVEWNTRINLTRLVSPHNIAVEHFLDSISLLTIVDIPADANLVDVGAGAGFPSLPLKIMRPDLKITLLEATAKKLNFCRTVVETLGLADVRLVHGRAEATMRERVRGFDVVTARAVAHLDKLLPWCEPFVKPKTGIIAAFKGARASEEVAQAEYIISMLKLKVEIKNVLIPGSDRAHALVVCRK